jgi:hypothetical protein
MKIQIIQQSILKFRTLIVIIFCLLICSNYAFSQQTNAISTYFEYQVFKIDSIGSYYLIFVQRDRLKYQILSVKYENNCRNIFVNHNYNLNIYIPKGYLLDPPHIHGINIPDTTFIEIPYKNDSCEWGIYFTEDIKGLCYKCGENMGQTVIEKLRQENVKFYQIKFKNLKVVEKSMKRDKIKKRKPRSRRF